MDNRSVVREFLGNLLRNKGDKGDFADDELLITRGRLASVDAVEMIFLLEEKCGLDFSAPGIGKDDLDSVESILRLMEKSAP